MQVKVSAATNQQLDFMVAKCEDFNDGISIIRVWNNRVVKISHGDHETADTYTKYTPSTDWVQAGPIIERELITTVFCSGDLGEPRSYWTATNEMQCWQWGYGPYHEQDDDKSLQIYRNELYIGDTPLIAAMRCFVASKLGTTVEIPDELC